MDLRRDIIFTVFRRSISYSPSWINNESCIYGAWSMYFYRQIFAGSSNFCLSV